MPGHRLLIVAYAFPPMPSVGARRWDAMGRHLRLLGNEVTVVTTSAFGCSLDADQERWVRRAPDLTAAPWLRRLARRGPLPPPSDAPAAAWNSHVESPLPEGLRKVFVPDFYVAAWVPQALAIAHRVVSREEIDCVITTSPYESAHLIGPPLRRGGPAWIADFRDGWSFEPHRPAFPSRIQRSADRRMERWIVSRADRVMAATRPIAEDLRARLGIDAVHVPNGFDPLMYGQLPPVELPPLGDDSRVLVHTGQLSGHSGRDPRPLFAAIERLRQHRPEAVAQLRVVLAGRLSREDARLVSDSGLDEHFVVLGELPHAETLSLQRRADALLLLASAGGREATGKLFEYLSAARPILALAGPEVARIVSETQTGVTVTADDVDAIAEQLRRLLTGDIGRDYRPVNLEQYVYPGPARRVAAVIDDAIAARSAALA